MGRKGCHNRLQSLMSVCCFTVFGWVTHRLLRCSYVAFLQKYQVPRISVSINQARDLQSFMLLRLHLATCLEQVVLQLPGTRIPSRSDVGGWPAWWWTRLSEKQYASMPEVTAASHEYTVSLLSAEASILAGTGSFKSPWVASVLIPCCGI